MLQTEFSSGPNSIKDESLLTRCIACLIFVVFLLGFVMCSVGWFGSMPGDLGDSRFNNYFLEHVWLWMSGANVILWSPSFFFPFENILGFSDNHFGSVLFYSLFRLLGAPREYAFDAWFVIGAILNFFASFWALRQFRFGLIPCAFGAFIFSASLPVLMADNTAQLNYRFAIPLAWFLFYRALEQYPLKNAWLYFGFACLCIAEQFLCSIYLGVLLVYSLGALAIAWWWVNRKRVELNKNQAHQDLSSDLKIREAKQHTKLLGIALTTIAALITGALLFQYHQIAKEYGLSRSNAEVITMLPKIGSYFLSDRSFLSGLWSTNLGWFAQRQENQLFVGLGAMLFLVAGIYSSWRSSYTLHAIAYLGRIAFLSTAIVWIMTIQIGGYSLYSGVLHLPGINAIRSVGRVILVLLFPISILVAIAMQAGQAWLNSKLAQEKPIFIAVLLAIFSLLLLLPESIFARHDTTLIGVWRNRIQKLQALMPASSSADAIVFVPRSGSEPSWAGELDGMLFAQDIGLPTINGYSGSLPPGYPDLGVSARARFEAYAKLRHQSDAWVEEQLKRVITLKTNFEWLKNQRVTTSWGQTLLTNSENPSQQIYLVEGWAFPEPWGTWILGKDAQLLIPLPKSEGLGGGGSLAHEILLQVRPFVSKAHPQLRASYQVNGSVAQGVEWHLSDSSQKISSNTLRIPIRDADLAKGFLDIALHIDNPISPKMLGIGQDERVLGLGLEFIALK